MGVIKKIGGIVAKLRGKALKVAVTAVVTLGCMVLSVNLPEPTKQAIVSGSVVVIEAFLSTDEASTEPGGTE